jgi:hypothetical protein
LDVDLAGLVALVGLVAGVVVGVGVSAGATGAAVGAGAVLIGATVEPLTVLGRESS